jgi:WD40 repeat protein
MKKISSMCWSANGKKLAICGSDRVVNLYNSEGEYKDRFPAKSGEKGYKSYVIR